MKCFVVDPSYLTPPYDKAFMEGLAAAGVDVEFFTRVSRPIDEALDIAEPVHRSFYRWSEAHAGRLGPAFKGVKAVEHGIDMLRFLALVRRSRPSVVHLQWLMLPQIDARLIRAISKTTPVVVTVHDTTPFNGNPSSRLQGLGFLAALREADALIVHTEIGATRLTTMGLAAERISVIPHGPLKLPGFRVPPPLPVDHDRPWNIVAFGFIKPYKGTEALIEAVGRLDTATTAGLRVVVAGEPLMPIEHLLGRIEALGLRDVFDLRLRRCDEMEVAEIFAAADAFVFPYLEIEASGVLFLVQNLGRWMIASRLGAFAEVITSDEIGVLIPPGDVDALAAAIAEGVKTRPIGCPARVTSWREIGARTLDLYRRLIDAK